MFKQIYESSSVFDFSEHPIFATYTVLCALFVIVSFCLVVLDVMLRLFSKKSILDYDLYTMPYLVSWLFIGMFFITFFGILSNERYQIYEGHVKVEDIKEASGHTLNENKITLMSNGKRQSFTVDNDKIADIRKDDNVRVRLKVENLGKGITYLNTTPKKVMINQIASTSNLINDRKQPNIIYSDIEIKKEH